jgi:hypothetical protein
MRPVQEGPNRKRGQTTAVVLSFVLVLVFGCNQDMSPTTGTESRAAGSKPKTVAAQTEGAWDGSLDHVGPAYIDGWVWDQNRPDRVVRVDIYDGETKIATILADQFRQDLLDGNKGTGKYGFSFPIPPELKDGFSHTIRVVVADANHELNGSPQTVSLKEINPGP